MEYRRLGRTNLKVSTLGLGSGGRSKLGQASGSGQAEVNKVVRCALERGINLFDTAPGYGTSEELLGNALADTPREQYVLCTKFQPLVEGQLKAADALRSTLERSLSRLKTDHVDVLYLHGVNPRYYAEIAERFVPLLEAARDDGLIRFGGITENFSADYQHQTLREAATVPIFDVMMMGYNLMSPSATTLVLPLAAEHDIGIVVMCAVRGALLDRKRVSEIVAEWKQAGVPGADALPSDNVLESVLGSWADDITAAAYRFAADPPGVGTVLSGTGNPAHLVANIEAIEAGPLPREIIDRIHDVFGPVGRSVSF